jgi:hypothetical protein
VHKRWPSSALAPAAGKSGKKVPASFLEIIDCLVDVLLRYHSPTPEPAAEGKPGALLLRMGAPCLEKHRPVLLACAAGRHTAPNW